MIDRIIYMKRIIAILALTLISVGSLMAQDYRFEVGPAAGISGYLGDVNNSKLFKHPGFTGGGLFRYIINSRWALKADVIASKISGNSKDIDTQFPGGAQYSFKSTLYDFGAQMEFNFLNFGSGAKYKKYSRISPYMVLGLGGVVASSAGKTNFSFVLPMGIGVKYKLKERLNLGLEFTMRKEFSDKIDGLSDLNGVKHTFAKNTDWYSFTVLSLTYEFSKRCTKCHYVE